MNNRIILNLEKMDFSDSYDIANSEFWQKAAAEKLSANLNTIGALAKKYKQKRKENKNSAPLQNHDAIFVTGCRGAGKTVFLKNAHKIWQENRSSSLSELPVDLHFASTIDPTLLIGHDSFTNVVVAHLYNEVEAKFLDSANSNEYQKTEFYNRLKKLASALSDSGDYDDRVGIDRIIKYRSGVQVETFFHDFVEECINIIGVDAIVLPIDDVDMALERAYEVLDVVRRMLGCPYIIPMLSGDEPLYQHMVKLQFTSETVNKDADELTRIEGNKIASRLSDSYLTKVFPGHLRIDLLSVQSLMANLTIVNNADDDREITYKSYETGLKRTFWGLTNGLERSTEYPEPQNAREIVQLVKIIPPSTFSKKIISSDWESLKLWANLKKHGATYTNAVSTQQFLQFKNSENTEFSLSKLLAFNPKAQANLGIRWASKNFENEQLNANNEIEKGARSSNEFILEGAISGAVLRSMPPLEFHTQRMTIPAKNINKNSSQDARLFIYTHKDFYGEQRQTAYKVFFSRAFEILANSLLLLDSEKQVEEPNGYWSAFLHKAIQEPPFYCIHAMNPTKYTSKTDDQIVDDSDDVLDDDNDELGEKIDFIMSFSKEIALWQNKYSKVLKELIKETLIPLLHAVFNKVFTQLHLFRLNPKHDDEHLTDTIRRFEYIVINSFASFLNKTNVVKANLATGAKPDTLRNHLKFINHDHVFTRNLKGFVDLKTGESISKKVISKIRLEEELVEAIWNHPIFKINYSRSDNLKPLFAFKSEAKKAKIIPKPRGKQLSKTRAYIKDKYDITAIKDINVWLKSSNDLNIKNELYSKASTEIDAKEIKIKELNNDFQEFCKILGIED